MSNNKKAFLIILITAAITALLTYECLSPAPQVSIAPLQQQVKQDQTRIDAINKVYVADMKKLQKKNDSLMKVVSASKVSLTQSNVKVSQLEKKVNQLADTIKKSPDTAIGKIALGDSLGKETTILITQEEQRDSICEDEVSTLTAVVSEKDSALADCQQSYFNMKQQADTALQQEQSMLLAIKGLDKALRRDKRQSRLLSVGLLILTGVSATLFLTQQGKL